VSNQRFNSDGELRIEIRVNGAPTRVPPALNVRQLLEFLALDASRIAVELNRRIVRKSQWDETPVEDGAQLEIVEFVGGG
jgi:thiamine biosynthesis protein ThiS